MDEYDDFSDIQYQQPHEPRKSKARERIERRRQQTRGSEAVVKPMTVMPPSVTPRATPRVRSQVVPTGTIDFKLSDLPLRYIRLISYIVGTIILFFGVIIALSLFKDEGVKVEPNALWLGTEWTYNERSDQEVAALAEKLRTHRIGTVYAWVTWINGQGQWSGNSNGTMPFSDRQERVESFVQQIKAAYPEVKLYAWIGYPTEGAGIPYRLNDTAISDEVAKFSARTIKEFGFDGVFLNVEPVWNKNAPDFVKFLSRVRLEIGDDAPISVAIPPDWTPLGVNVPQPLQVAPGTAWDKDFKKRVALLTDELAVMAYNSGLRNPIEYRDWVAYQVQSYAEAVDELDIRTRVIIGIPTHPNELPGHDTMVENVPSAIAGIRIGLGKAGDAAKVISGVALYAEWTTDNTEWLEFKTGWSDQQK